MKITINLIDRSRLSCAKLKSKYCNKSGREIIKLKNLKIAGLHLAATSIQMQYILNVDPNAMKHEINQYKYITNCDPYPLSHIAEYLAMKVYFHEIHYGKDFLEFPVSYKIHFKG
jgi:hypothetical protein